MLTAERRSEIARKAAKARWDKVSEWKKGTCAWCGEDGDVYRDNGYCEDCDNKVVHCTVCDEDVDSENKCRHVFLDENFIWHGAGCGNGEDDRDIRDSFLTLLRLMPNTFPGHLATAIKAGEFFTWLVAPLIGSGGILELNGMNGLDFPGCKGYFGYGQCLLEIGAGGPWLKPKECFSGCLPEEPERSWRDYKPHLGEQLAEESGDGYRWLVSLYRNETGWANTRTLEWIALFLSGGMKEAITRGS